MPVSLPLVTGLGSASLIPHLLSYLICLIGLWKSGMGVRSNRSDHWTGLFTNFWHKMIAIAVSKTMPKFLAIVGCSFYHLSFILRFLTFEAVENRKGHTLVDDMQSFGGYFWILQRNLAEFIALGSISIFFLQFYYDIYVSMTKWKLRKSKGTHARRTSHTADRNLQGFRIRTSRILLSLLAGVGLFVEILMCSLSPEQYPCVLIIQLFKMTTETCTLLISLVMLAILIRSLVAYNSMTSESNQESTSKPKRALQKLLNIYVFMVVVLVMALLDPILHGVGSPYPYYPNTLDWNYKIGPLNFIYGFVGMFAVTPLIIESKSKQGGSSHLGSTNQKSKFVSSVASKVESPGVVVNSV